MPGAAMINEDTAEWEPGGLLAQQVGPTPFSSAVRADERSRNHLTVTADIGLNVDRDHFTGWFGAALACLYEHPRGFRL